MGDSNKILLIVAGLFITLLIIFFGFRIYNFAHSKGEDATVKLDKTFTEMGESTYTQYHGEMVSGGSVSNFIKECEARTDGVYVTVKTNKNTSGVTYVYDTSGNKITTTNEMTLVKNSKTRTHSDYINPGQLFYGEVVRDTSNNSIIGIVFTEEPNTP